jgi:hypothetical protein
MNTKAVVEHTAASSLARTLDPDTAPPAAHAHRNGNNLSRSESSSSDSVNSQDGIIQFKRSGSLGGSWSGQVRTNHPHI